MPIGVGINENVILTKADVNEKGSLELTFDEAAIVDKPKASVFDSLQTAKVENDGDTSRTLLLFPFKKPTGVRNEGKTEDELIEMVSDDMKRVKNQLTQLLQIYLTEDKITWDPFAGTGVTNENYREMFLNDDALSRIFKNYAEQFIAMVTPFLGDTKYKLRVKLVRQSTDKHFATIPGRFLLDRPWVESMDIPAEQAKVKFSEWEISQKMNDPTPTAKPRGEGSGGEEQVPEAKTNPFGTR